MSTSRKYICFKGFKSKKGLSKSKKMQGEEKVPMDSTSDDRMHSSTSDKGYRRKIKKYHRGFSCFFKAIKSKKKQIKKQEDDLSRSSINVLGGPLRDNPPLDAGSISVSSRTSLFSSSTMRCTSSSAQPSSSCSSIANSRSGSERKQSCLIDLNTKPLIRNTLLGKRSSGSNHFIYFVLVCLVGLVFGGKAFAIICTSGCLFLLPCCLREFASKEDQVDSPLDSVMNKTKLQDQQGNK